MVGPVLLLASLTLACGEGVVPASPPTPSPTYAPTFIYEPETLYEIPTIMEAPTLPQETLFSLQPEVSGAGVGKVEALPPPTDIHALIASYPWPYDQAISVATCESGLNPNAVSSANAVGIFQIHPYREEYFDPVANVAAAYSKYKDGVSRGNPWYHWNQFGSCGHF